LFLRLKQEYGFLENFEDISHLLKDAHSSAEVVRIILQSCGKVKPSGFLSDLLTVFMTNDVAFYCGTIGIGLAVTILVFTVYDSHSRVYELLKFFKENMHKVITKDNPEYKDLVKKSSEHSEELKTSRLHINEIYDMSVDHSIRLNEVDSTLFTLKRDVAIMADAIARRLADL
jgi:hypothetical protein